MQRTRHDLQIALDRHLLRIERQLLNQTQNGRGGGVPHLAVDFDTHQECPSSNKHMLKTRASFGPVANVEAIARLRATGSQRERAMSARP
ncbi:hypothetical protein D3C87_1924960 [compost metagenome]